MIRAIVFDLDNTLVDFMSMKKLAVKSAIDAPRPAKMAASRGSAEAGVTVEILSKLNAIGGGRRLPAMCVSRGRPRP